MYATVINGQVVGCSYTLPRTYGNIDGFDRLSAKAQKDLGIYPLEEIKPELLTTPVDTGEVDKDNNPIIRHVPTQQYGSSTDVITSSKVTRTYSVINRPQADIADDINRPVTKAISILEIGSLLPRVTREFMLAAFAAQANAAGVDPMTNVGYARMKALDDEISVLRRKLL